MVQRSGACSHQRGANHGVQNHPKIGPGCTSESSTRSHGNHDHGADAGLGKIKKIQ
jgi:hypothetical protein